MTTGQKIARDLFRESAELALSGNGRPRPLSPAEVAARIDEALRSEWPDERALTLVAIEVTDAGTNVVGINGPAIPEAEEDAWYFGAREPVDGHYLFEIERGIDGGWRSTEIAYETEVERAERLAREEDRNG